MPADDPRRAEASRRLGAARTPETYAGAGKKGAATRKKQYAEKPELREAAAKRMLHARAIWDAQPSEMRGAIRSATMKARMKADPQYRARRIAQAGKAAAVHKANAKYERAKLNIHWQPVGRAVHRVWRNVEVSL